MKAIDKLIQEIADKMEEAIQEAKYEEERECCIEHYLNDGSWIEIASENNDYYDIHFYPADDEKDEKTLPNLAEAIYDAMPDWDDIEVEYEYDEWNEHGFRDAADYYHWRYG